MNIPACTTCKKHLTTRYSLKTLIPLVNVTREGLRQLTPEQLDLIEYVAKQGTKVCEACWLKCNANFKKCFGNSGEVFDRAYKHRLLENREVLKAVEQERQRRWNAKYAKSRVSSEDPYANLYPQVPTHDPFQK